MQLHFCRTAAQEHLTDLVGVCCCPLWGKAANPNGISLLFDPTRSSLYQFQSLYLILPGIEPTIYCTLEASTLSITPPMRFIFIFYLFVARTVWLFPTVSWQWKHGKLKLNIKTQIFTLLTLDNVKIQTKWRHYMLGDNTKHSWKSFSYCLKTKL